MKFYRFKIGDNEWSQNVKLRELIKLKLPDDARLWWNGLCPNKSIAEECVHTIDFKTFTNERPWIKVWYMIPIAKILLSTFLFTIIFSIGYNFYRVRKNMKIEKALNSRIDTLSTKMEEQVNNYYLSQKQANVISDDIQPEFKIYTRTEDNVRILNTEFSYMTDTVCNTEIYDYRNGSYLYSESAAAKTMLMSAKLTIEKFILKSLKNNDGVDIVIKGFTDATPVSEKLRYKGEYDSFPQKVKDNFVSSYILNDIPQKIKLEKNDQLDNPKLSFLRAFSIYEFLENYIPYLSGLKTNYSFYGYTQPDKSKVGGKYRKVAFSLKIKNPIDLPPAIDIKEPDNNTKTINTVAKVLYYLITGVGLALIIGLISRWWKLKANTKNPKVIRKHLLIVLSIYLICSFIYLGFFL